MWLICRCIFSRATAVMKPQNTHHKFGLQRKPSAHTSELAMGSQRRWLRVTLTWCHIISATAAQLWSGHSIRPSISMA